MNGEDARDIDDALAVDTREFPRIESRFQVCKGLVVERDGEAIVEAHAFDIEISLSQRKFSLEGNFLL